MPAPADFELKLPDGAKYDPDGLGQFKQIMADEKLTPAQRAEKVLALDQKVAKSAQAKYAAELNRRAQEMRTKDIETLKADPKYGGTKYEETVKASRAAAQISEHGPAVSKLLEASGLDNHPDIVRFLADVRSKISEDTTPAPGTPPAKVAPTPAKTQTERGAAMYGQLREQKKAQAKK